MNQGLKKEITLLAGLASAGLFLFGKRRAALLLGAAATGLRLSPSRPVSFRGKSVVIAGGSRGLGYALAKRFLAEGANVTLIARDQLELDRAWAKLTQNCRDQLAVISCDLKDKASLRMAYEETKSRFGSIDLLINNAGAISAGPFETMKTEDFEAQMNIHFYGILNSVLAALPIFRSQGEGRIVNICSIGGKIPIPHLSPYCASKFALAGLSQTLGVELQKDGIHVTTVYPGLMRTGSAVQAVLKGDHEKEFAWFTVANSLPGLSMDADLAARKIVQAVREGRTEVRLSLPTKLATWAHHFFPETFAGLMGLANRFLPAGASIERRTGASSQGWLQRQPWSAPFQKVQQEARARFNEEQKEDADFNMNLESARS